MSFFGELRRRNVVKVAVAYAIVGWLLVQIADTFFPALQLPDWTVTFVAGLVILGLPLALILSWAYELTPDGMERTKSVPLSESITHVTGRKIDFAIIGALVLALGFVIYNYVPEDGSDDVTVAETGPSVLPNSVAVIPFRNDSPDPDNAYYAAGIHEEILNQLVKLSALTVISRTSVERYANTDQPIPQIARELNVETVMEGSVRYADGQIRITTQLNDGITGAHLWSETYTRDFEDIFVIESDVAMNVANALEAEFSLEEQESIERIPTSSLDAYAYYLKGLSTVRLRGGFVAFPEQATVVEGVAALNNAIALDPAFALAYAAKALIYSQNNSWLIETGLVSDGGEASVLARQFAETALRLDPAVGAAHLVLALQARSYSWTEARERFEQAFQLNPNDTDLLLIYVQFSLFSGQPADAIRLAQHLVQLDRRNPLFALELGWAHSFAGNYEAASAGYQRAVELDPVRPEPYLRLAMLELSRGNLDQALEHARFSEQLAGDTINRAGIVSEYAYVYARTGALEDAVRIADRLPSNAFPQALATVQLARGSNEEALATLRSDAERLEANNVATPAQPTYAFILWNTYNDPILDRPEWVQIRERLTLAGR